MYQSVIQNRRILPEELLWKNTPEEEIGNFDYLIEVIDWEKNIDPKFMETNFRKPKPVKDEKEMLAEGYSEKWICYDCDGYRAKELTVLPGKTVTIFDDGAYGIIMMQGHGKMGVWDIETPALIRYGQLTNDEYFVSVKAAKEGVEITNLSKSDPIVMLKHFGPKTEED